MHNRKPDSRWSKHNEDEEENLMWELLWTKFQCSSLSLEVQKPSVVRSAARAGSVFLCFLVPFMGFFNYVSLSFSAACRRNHRVHRKALVCTFLRLWPHGDAHHQSVNCLTVWLTSPRRKRKQMELWPHVSLHWSKNNLDPTERERKRVSIKRGNDFRRLCNRRWC